jgi:nucleoside-diphosphate-sugar epimerase
VIVAVTGATGFIGRHLVARHLARGDTVRCLTRDPSRQRGDGAHVFPGSLASSTAELRKFAQGADVLYHCAAELRNEAEMHNTNVAGTGHLIAAARGEIGRWVQLSSTGVYGRAHVGSGRSIHGRSVCRDISEEAVVNPTNAYESSKLASDNLLREMAALKDFSFVVVRPSNVYATDMPNQSLFQLIRMINRGLFFFIGQPDTTANYVHVENVVDALMLCATANLPDNGRAYIVSDHRGLETFVQIIAAALGKPTPRLRVPETLIRAVCAVVGKVPGFPLSPSRIDALCDRIIYSSDRLKSELGFENKISMEMGISELALHFKNTMTRG